MKLMKPFAVVVAAVLISTAVTLSLGGDDDTAAIQAAVNTVPFFYFVACINLSQKGF